MLKRLACAFALASLVLSTAACASLPGGGEPSVSPRHATLKAAEQVEPVLSELTNLVSVGVLSDNLTDDIAQYGPDVQKILAAYFDGAEACVVVGAQLVTETTTGRECQPNVLLSLYNQLDGEILRWAMKTGVDTDAGKAIYAGRLVLAAVPKPKPGGPFAGYRDEPDVPLADFQARRAQLKAEFEALLSAAATRAAAPKAKK